MHENGTGNHTKTAPKCKKQKPVPNKGKKEISLKSCLHFSRRKRGKEVKIWVLYDVFVILFRIFLCFKVPFKIILVVGGGRKSTFSTKSINIRLTMLPQNK